MRRGSKRREPLPVTKGGFVTDTLHSGTHPHWSEAGDWRPGRWDPMVNAPSRGNILNVRGRGAQGETFEPMHYACGGGEEQPYFVGWFVPDTCGGFVQVHPVEWQPLRAAIKETA